MNKYIGKHNTSSLEIRISDAYFTTEIVVSLPDIKIKKYKITLGSLVATIS